MDIPEIHVLPPLVGFALHLLWHEELRDKKTAHTVPGLVVVLSTVGVPIGFATSTVFHAN